MTELPALPRKLLLSLSVGQGVALYFLYRAHDLNVWPSEAPLWSYPLWTLIVAVPVLLLLSLDNGNLRSILKQVGMFAAVLALLAIYIGWQAEPFGEFRLGELTMVYALTTALACFKALMYLQQRASGAPMTYDVLFSYSWRNFLTAALAGVFVLAFWLTLVLWAELFKSIGIIFFRDLFHEEWFLFPILGFAAGLGVIIFRQLVHVIDSITRLLQGLIKLLLPLVILIGVIFLLSLPVVGLDALWSTGNGTALLFWLLAVTLFFANAVYQDGRGDIPYPPLVHKAIYAGMALLPVVSALSLYGLWLRLAQYGWTVDRCWAFLVWLVLSLFAFGYSYGILRERDRWTQHLARVNTGMGLVVLGLMLVSNSPLLDFRKISVSSQLARVESGEVELKNFDYWYARQSLGRPGYMAVESIKQDIGDSDPVLLQQINEPRPLHHAVKLMDIDEFWKRMTYRPESFDVDQDFREYVFAVAGSVGETAYPFLFRVHLDDDDDYEYVLASRIGNYVSQSYIFYREANQWAHMNAGPSGGFYPRYGNADHLKDGEISVEALRFDRLRIGDIVITPVPTVVPEDKLSNEPTRD